MDIERKAVDMLTESKNCGQSGSQLLLLHPADHRGVHAAMPGLGRAWREAPNVELTGAARLYAQRPS